ncbi:carbohydrate ABC transporter permease [Paenibacillus camerounensis]|uniref:carbohydrate ABC transporter permease n=1 Tax=Paenibacillus camerounensis TaxID=1243663 RepID=UPI0005A92B5F|nr:carbohydrate ABC transporter permease [Paenibacillus camerounensis]
MSSGLSRGQRVFEIFNIVFLTLAAFACLVPFIHIVAVSFSNSAAVQGGMVNLWPVNFTIEPYKYVMERGEFWRSFGTTLQRVAIGATLNVLLVVLTAYPLSKSVRKLKARTIYVWIFFFVMLFNGGLIPNYLLVKELNLLNTIWALVLPGAVPVFSVILMLNFFREIPDELEEAAYVDGAGHWRILFQMYIPLSLPAVATISLFAIVGHWNTWFDGLIYMKSENYPLQTYLQTIISSFQNMESLSATDLMSLANLNDRSIKAAQLILGALPVLCVYPFLQKYFVKGIRLGGVKG